MKHRLVGLAGTLLWVPVLIVAALVWLAYFAWLLVRTDEADK